MGRIVFENIEQMVAWAKDQADPTKYIGYITKENEIILKPTKDPRARDFAYVKHDEEITKELLAKHFVREDGKGNTVVIPLKFYQMKTYDWRLDMPVGVRVAVV